MRIIDYLQSLPKGEVVGKKGLAYLKRKGFIWDYSRFGYIEGLWIRGALRDGEPYRDEVCLELSRNARCAGAERLEGAMYGKWRQGQASCDMTANELNTLLSPSSSFEFEGMTFRLEYIDGCMKPYLIKEKDDSQPATVTRRLAFREGVV